MDIYKKEGDRVLLKTKKKNYDYLFSKIADINEDIYENDNMSDEGEKKNQLYDGKFGKFSKTFNLQILKKKMWEILDEVREKNFTLDG